MIIGENFYSWNPIFFQPIDPNNGRYFGNVIGNVSLEDQLDDVSNAGNAEKEDILTLGIDLSETITRLAQKYISLWSIIDNVERSITGNNSIERLDASQLVEDFISNYSPDIFDEEDPSIDTPSMISDEVCDAEYYSWNPNLFRIEKPDESGYFGNVIGNIPTQEQLDEVRDAGSKQKELIEDLGISLSDTIVENSEKYRSIANININAMSSIIEMFGGVFVLGSSTLDSTPLG